MSSLVKPKGPQGSAGFSFLPGLVCLGASETKGSPKRKVATFQPTAGSQSLHKLDSCWPHRRDWKPPQSLGPILPNHGRSWLLSNGHSYTLWCSFT